MKYQCKTMIVIPSDEIKKVEQWDKSKSWWCYKSNYLIANRNDEIKSQNYEIKSRNPKKRVYI